MIKVYTKAKMKELDKRFRATKDDGDIAVVEYKKIPKKGKTQEKS